MAEELSAKELKQSYPEGFRKRRGLNWTSLGLMYAGYYICRYSFKFATPGLQDEYGYTTTQLSDIWAIWSLAYGTGQLINGLLSDKIGGKKCMLIGGVASVIVNLLFGFSSLAGMFGSFAAIYLVNGYFQSFGAPGMIKINAAWFKREERGTFAGIFGLMIQLGKMGIAALAPWILSGMVIFGTAYLPDENNWKWLFRLPPFITLAAAIFMWIVAKSEPSEAGFPGVIEDEIDNSEGTTVKAIDSIKYIFANPFVWFYAVAYASTGAVRHSSDQLSNLFFNDQLQVDMAVAIPILITITFILEPWIAAAGSIISGFISDKIFKGARAPVAVFLYFIEALVIGVSAIVLLNGFLSPESGNGGIILACIILLGIAFTVNSTHSLVGAAAPMDIGGKKMAGFAAGVIDSFQYYGAAISLFITGRVLDATKEEHGWLFWFILMSGFGVIGGVSMILLVRKQKRLNGSVA